MKTATTISPDTKNSMIEVLLFDCRKNNVQESHILIYVRQMIEALLRQTVDMFCRDLIDKRGKEHLTTQEIIEYQSDIQFLFSEIVRVKHMENEG